MTDDIVKRLTVKAGVIEMGEQIAWGSDTALMREAAHVIEALRKQMSVGEGWRLVPEEPTEAMLDATAEVIDCPVSIYFAMLDAAPQPEETKND